MHALSFAPDVIDWLANSRNPRILHIFDRACNLINERRDVLSIVTPQIGNGPFNLVLPEEICFSDDLHPESPVSISSTHLTLGYFIIHFADAKLWNPRLDWEKLHARKGDISHQLSQLTTLAPGASTGVTNYLNYGGLDTPFAKTHFGRLSATAQSYSTSTTSQSLMSNLSKALVNAHISSARKVSSQLAGLGIGLTPAGDDFLMGALYAAWIIHPSAIASVLATEIAATAAPLTTSLSAAWLRSAARGEAGILWHEFFDALLVGRTGSPTYLQKATENICAVGETSGADALAGFLSVFLTWREKADFSHG